MRWEPIWTRTQFAWDRNSSATSYEPSITHKQVPTRRRDDQRYQQKNKKNLVRQKPSSINCEPYIKCKTSFGRRARVELCHEATFAQVTYPTQFLDHSWPIRQLFPATVGNKYSNNSFFGYCSYGKISRQLFSVLHTIHIVYNCLSIKLASLISA